MDSLIVSLNAVLPLFIMMAAGYIAKCMGFLREEDISRFNTIPFRVFVPCLLFYNVYTSDLTKIMNPGFIVFALVCFAGVYLASLIFTLLIEKSPERRGVMIQGLYRSNIVGIGIPIATAFMADGDLGSVVLLTAIMVPIYNMFAVITLESFRGGKIDVSAIFISIVKNPLIIGTALGVAASLLNIKLPSFLVSSIHSMGAAGMPLMLFLLGGFFSLSSLKKCSWSLIAVVLGRLVVVPAIVMPLASLMGYRGMEFLALLGCFASSAAVGSFTMTQEMGGDAELAGNIVILTSGLSPITLFFWGLLFKSLGMF